MVMLITFTLEKRRNKRCAETDVFIFWSVAYLVILRKHREVVSRGVQPLPWHAERSPKMYPCINVNIRYTKMDDGIALLTPLFQA